MVHANTRKRELVDKLHNLGMSISYDWVPEIPTNIGNAVCQQFHQEEVLCPSNLRKDYLQLAHMIILIIPECYNCQGIIPWYGNIPIPTPNRKQPGRDKKSYPYLQRCYRKNIHFTSHRRICLCKAIRSSQGEA